MTEQDAVMREVASRWDRMEEQLEMLERRMNHICKELDELHVSKARKSDVLSLEQRVMTLQARVLKP